MRRRLHIAVGLIVVGLWLAPLPPEQALAQVWTTVTLDSDGDVGKYADLKKAMTDMVDATGGFADDVDKAEDGEGVAKAIQRYVVAMEGLEPRMQELQEKYPELADGIPEELKELEGKFEEAGNRMIEAMGKLIQYADHPAVQKAMEEFQNVGQ